MYPVSWKITQLKKMHSWVIWDLKGHTAAAKSLQTCPTLCDPIDGSPPGFPVPGILQARTLEWVAISFSNACKWRWKWNRSVVSNPQRPHGLQPSRLLRPWDFPGKRTGVGCHCLLLKGHNVPELFSHWIHWATAQLSRYYRSSHRSWKRECYFSLC